MPPLKAAFSVDDEYFSVIPVIVMSGEKRRDLGESLRFNAHRGQRRYVISRKRRHASDVIVHHPDFYAGTGFSLQDFQNRIPEDSFTNDEKFEKNKRFRLFELSHDLRESVVAQRKILYGGVAVRCITAGVFDVLRQREDPPVLRAKRVADFRAVREYFSVSSSD